MSLKRQKILERKEDVGKGILELNSEGVQQKNEESWSGGNTAVQVTTTYGT